MNVAVRPGWGLPHLVLAGLTAAVVASSPLGVLHNLSQLPMPFASAPIEGDLGKTPEVPVAPPFVFPAKDAVDLEQATRCLGQAVYYEAGFQPVEGKRAVAQVILNRVRDRNFPSTVCGVVYEGWQRRTGCQFSFVCDGSLHRRPPSADELQSAEKIALDALNGYVMAAVGTATHYHTWKIDPYWNDTLVKTAQIGDHIFYRWPGKAGRPQALNDEHYDGDELRAARHAPKQALLG